MNLTNIPSTCTQQQRWLSSGLDAPCFADSDDACFSSDDDEGAGDARLDGGGVTVVELCGAAGGHITGMLLAALLPPHKVKEIVLVDSRWPSTSGANSSASFSSSNLSSSTTSSSSFKHLPTQHVDSTGAGADGYPWRIPVSRWKANVKSGSHLRSLHRALSRTSCQVPSQVPGLAGGVLRTRTRPALNVRASSAHPLEHPP